MIEVSRSPEEEILCSNGYIPNNMFTIDSAIPAGLSLGKGDALLIVPPFATTLQPCFGVHVLQSCSRRQGYEVKILYANLLLAASIGCENYEAICEGTRYGFPESNLIGERFFAGAAYGLPPLGSDGFIDSDRPEISAPMFSEIKLQERKAAIWADTVANFIAAHDFKIVGCSTTFQQTASSIALLDRVKRLRTDILTIIGGANCEGIMARGILSLSDSIDYVFSGECEVAVPDFLARVREGRLPSEKIVRGRPCAEIEDLPLPDYVDFFQQHRLILPAIAEEKYGAIFYESSRGCWWGEKRKCAFCAFNREYIGYRSKSAERVFSDLKGLREKYPDKSIQMTDNVLPSEYFKSLIPRLEKELPNADLFYMVRPNLSLKEIAALKRAGINGIFAGIESLSTPTLKLMRKGVTSRQNLAFLRYAVSSGLYVVWAMLTDIPGEQVEEVERMVNLIPLLRHLQPPYSFSLTVIQRFSPYFSNPGEYGLDNIRPLDSYFAALPGGADVENVAYEFKAKYRSAFRDYPDGAKRLMNGITIWQTLWRSGCIPPSLTVVSKEDGKFMLLDTRGLPGTNRASIIGRDEAKVALAEVGLKRGDKLLEWAIERKLVAEMDSTFVPLATGSPDLIMEFEEEEKLRATC